MTMIKIVMIGAENTTAIGTIVITPTTITERGMTNEGSMQTDKDIGTTRATTEEGISVETYIIDRSRRETQPVHNQSNGE